MTTRLDLYNKALLVCGERFLAALTEDREPRRLLDHVWNTGGNNFCLEAAQWWFAMRTTMIDYDPAITPTFGYRKAFTKPTDWISTSAVCSDEYFNSPLTQYADEMSNWYADITPIYVKYVSNDALYGGDLARWPATFVDYAAAYYASLIIGKLAGDRAAQLLKLFGPPGAPQAGLLHQTLHKAKNAAAQTQPTQFPAQGNWTRSRGGGRGGNDRGNRGSLLG
ncbi:MAG TPA: hypothetical protein PLO69_14585 [Gammaproteobacteria bacterium]|nr:hypothetical protein [Gammaproteobacteria bacterium]